MSLMVWVEIYQRWELSGLSHVIGMGSDSRSNLIKAFETEVWSSVPQDPPDWQEILTNWRGSELQNYFTRILEDDLQAIIKPQYVDHIPKAVRGNVLDVIASKDERGLREPIMDVLELRQVCDRNVADLSGGELQRFAIAVVVLQAADIYMIDEPSSYLDVKQRLKAMTDEAIDKGVFGAPTLFVGDEMFFGQDRLWQVEQVLQSNTEKDHS